MKALSQRLHTNQFMRNGLFLSDFLSRLYEVWSVKTSALVINGYKALKQTQIGRLIGHIDSKALDYSLLLNQTTRNQGNRHHMYHVEFITEDGWETAFAANHQSACLLADALQDACGDDIRAYYVQPAEAGNPKIGPEIIPLDWRKHIQDGLYLGR